MIQRTHKPRSKQSAAKKSQPTQAPSEFPYKQIQRAIENPNPQTLTPDTVMQLQATHGNQYVLGLVQRMQEESAQSTMIQRGGVGDVASMGDIGGAIVSVYEAYNGDQSANTYIKAITELSGNFADTSGAVGDSMQGVSTNLVSPSAQGLGTWSRLAGGLTSMWAKGSQLVSQTAGYVQSGLEYTGLSGGNMSAATTWLGGWAKSASDVISPHVWYTDLIAAGSKAVNGITDGWNAGYILQDLHKLGTSGSTAEAKKAANLLFDIAWWKRLQGYGQGAVGAIEGSAAVYFGPVSKGITAVLTKSYESGWGASILRAIGSSFTSSVYSNAQIKQQAEDSQNELEGTVTKLVANGKIADLAQLCHAATELGADDFAKKILEEFDRPPGGKEDRYRDRKAAFIIQARAKGFAGKLGIK